jgi:hypothetical protein
MENYDIRHDDKYGQLTHIDLAAEGAAHDPCTKERENQGSSHRRFLL